MQSVERHTIKTYTFVNPSSPYSIEAASTSMTMSVDKLAQFVYINSNTARKMGGRMSDRTRGAADSPSLTANMALKTSHLAASRHLWAYMACRSSPTMNRISLYNLTRVCLTQVIFKGDIKKLCVVVPAQTNL